MTRKRYKKLLMALGLSRNAAEEAARDVPRYRLSYAVRYRLSYAMVMVALLERLLGETGGGA